MHEFSHPDGDAAVELWSSIRIPFEPFGEAKNIREELRSMISALRGVPEPVLAASFTSNRRDIVDLENMLLYNVGVACFQACRAPTIQLQRLFESPRLSPAGIGYEHHYRYELINQPTPFDNARRIVAHFQTADLSAAGLRDPWMVWYALKHGQVNASIDDHSRLGLVITIETEPRRTTPFVMVKAVIDGAMTALHSHDGSNLEVVSERLGSRLSMDASVASAALTEVRTAVLGGRQLVWPRGHGLQMNPADDRLDLISVEVRPSKDSGSRIIGTLFSGVGELPTAVR